jgi:hypothetical protein
VKALLAGSLSSALSAALLSVVLGGCIAAAPVVPVTPDNQAAMGVCQSDALQHNGFVVADIALAGLASAGASAGAGLASSNPAASKDVAITAGVLGGLAVIDSVLVGYSASQFANSNCSALVGPLPVLPPMSKMPSSVSRPADAGAGAK